MIRCFSDFSSPNSIDCFSFSRTNLMQYKNNFQNNPKNVANIYYVTLLSLLLFFPIYTKIVFDWIYEYVCNVYG